MNPAEAYPQFKSPEEESESSYTIERRMPLPPEFAQLFREHDLENHALAYESASKLAEAVREAGGRALFVGGFVRDFLMGKIPKDFDIEIYNLEAEEIDTIVQQFGSVSDVGRAFNILKVFTEGGIDLDISLPRTDSKVGEGHRDFVVSGDPTMSIKEAARRRDFTINTVAADPLTGEIFDPFGGVADLQAGVLRVTDTERFQDDALRVLRGMQFVGRFGLRIDPESLQLMQAMAPQLKNLPKERVFEEWKKLLIKSVKPSLGLAAGMSLGVFEQLHEVLPPLKETPQEPEWHPEGDVWIHTMMVVDEAAKIAQEEGLDESEALILMLSALCHDLGKPETTEFIEGRIRSRGHEEAGAEPTSRFLDSIGIVGDSNILRNKIINLVKEHLAPTLLYVNDQIKKQAVSDGAIRNLANRLSPATIRELTLVAEADHRGRGPFFDPEIPEQLLLPDGFPAGPWLLKRARAIEVEMSKPADIIMGRHLIALGYKPGKDFRDIITAANTLRDELDYTKEQVLALLIDTLQIGATSTLLALVENQQSEPVE